MATIAQLPPKNIDGVEDWSVLLDAVPMSAVIFDRQMICLAQNAAHERMTGVGRENLVGRYMFDPFPPDPAPGAPNAEVAIRASVDRAWITKLSDSPPIQEHPLNTSDGVWETHAWRVTHSPLIRNGEVAAMLQTSEKLTEAALERALGHAQRLAAQNAAAISYFSYEPVSRQLARSEAVDSLFGFVSDEAGAFGAAFAERICPEDYPALKAELDRVRAAPVGTPFSIDFRILVPDEETPRFVRTRGAVVIDPADKVKKLVGAVADITDIEATRRQLEEAVQDKERLLVEVNHRVKNSLQLASSVLRMEARKADSEQIADVLDMANARVDAIAEVHAGLYLGGDVTQTSAGAVLRNIVASLGQSAGAGDTAAALHVSAAEFSLPTDLAIAFGLLVNELTTNALKYGGEPSAAPIEISTELKDDGVVLVVSNDVVEADAERAAPTGTGVGSQLIEGFVRQLKGEMTSDRTDGRFKVEITFPLLRSD